MIHPRPTYEDVVVVGGGPAGRAVAAACGARGLRTTLLDPTPDRPWRNTYGAWVDELPAELPGAVTAARANGRVIGQHEHDVGWHYATLDTAALRAHLDEQLAAGGVRVGRGRGVAVRPRGLRRTVWLGDGGTVDASVVIDAGGHRQPLARREPGSTRAEQTAVGVVVDESTAAPLVSAGDALFMDWRPDHGEAGWPTFLYGIPLGGGAVLLEETSLARRPGLPLPVLRARLDRRLAHHGIAVSAYEPQERVRFPVDTPRHPSRWALGFGAAAPLVHPASGYSVAAALRLAPTVAAAIEAGVPDGPSAAHAAGQQALWPAAARAVHALRHRGLEALLRMPPDAVPGFFDTFFELAAQHRWAYLTAREDLTATFAAMLALLPPTDWSTRRRLLGSVRYRPSR
ncbi:MAG: lycopene cyclase family protein [Pseudonocardia sp.]